MKDFGIALETEIFLLSVLLGGGMGIVYDFLRILRTLIKHGKIVTFAEDFFYMLLFGFALFTFSTGLTGSVRYFSLVGMILGCVIERYAIGNGVVFAVGKIWSVVKDKFFAPMKRFITKIAQQVRGLFVKKCKFSEKTKKVSQMS